MTVQGTNYGAQVEWNIKKGDYNTGGASTLVHVNLHPTRIEQLGVKQLMIESYVNSPDEIETNLKFPQTLLFDTGQSQKSFKIFGTFVDDGVTGLGVGSRYAYDKKNMLISMYDNSKLGSLFLSQFTNASGTNTGTESLRVQFINYNFIHEKKPDGNRIDYQLSFMTGIPTDEASA